LLLSPLPEIVVIVVGCCRHHCCWLLSLSLVAVVGRCRCHWLLSLSLVAVVVIGRCHCRCCRHNHCRHHCHHRCHINNSRCSHCCHRSDFCHHSCSWLLSERWITKNDKKVQQKRGKKPTINSFLHRSNVGGEWRVGPRALGPRVQRWHLYQVLKWPLDFHPTANGTPRTGNGWIWVLTSYMYRWMKIQLLFQYRCHPSSYDRYQVPGRPYEWSILQKWISTNYFTL